jgi:hypothetical protein
MKGSEQVQQLRVDPSAVALLRRVDDEGPMRKGKASGGLRVESPREKKEEFYG